MGIVRGPDGKYYDIDDNVLEQNEIKPDDLPADMARGSSGPPGPAGPPPSSGPGQGLVQVIVMPPGGPGAGGPGAGGPPGGPPPGAEAEGGADVAGHNYCNWSNWNNWNNWNNWYNSWRNCY